MKLPPDICEITSDEAETPADPAANVEVCSPAYYLLVSLTPISHPAISLLCFIFVLEQVGDRDYVSKSVLSPLNAGMTHENQPTSIAPHS